MYSDTEQSTRITEVVLTSELSFLAVQLLKGSPTFLHRRPQSPLLTSLSHYFWPFPAQKMQFNREMKSNFSSNGV